MRAGALALTDAEQRRKSNSSLWGTMVKGGFSGLLARSDIPCVVDYDR